MVYSCFLKCLVWEGENVRCTFSNVYIIGRWFSSMQYIRIKGKFLKCPVSVGRGKWCFTTCGTIVLTSNRVQQLAHGLFILTTPKNVYTPN